MNAGIAMDLKIPTTYQEYPLRVDSDHFPWLDIVYLNVRLFDSTAGSFEIGVEPRRSICKQ
jgi:hypothetical protein